MQEADDRMHSLQSCFLGVRTLHSCRAQFILAPSAVQVPGTNWIEPVLICMTIAMPTGSGK